MRELSELMQYTKMLSIISFVLLVVLANGAQVPIVPKLDGRIVGGVDVDIEDYPYQLALLRGPTHMCGASIISEYWAVTAAHCVDHGKPSLVTFRAGSSIRGSGGTIHEALQIVINNNYLGHDYDYALVKVRTPFPLDKKGVEAIQLATEEPYDGDIAIVTGWGTLSSGGRLPSKLQKVSVPIVSRSRCQDKYGTTVITNRMICAGYDEGNKDSCQGDSGGPLVVDGKLAGIVSWGRGCALANYPGVYANVALKKQWIKDVTGI